MKQYYKSYRFYRLIKMTYVQALLKRYKILDKELSIYHKTKINMIIKTYNLKRYEIKI